MPKRLEDWYSHLGDEWYERNKAVLGANDRIEEFLYRLDLPTNAKIMEIGCSNGWRLKKYEKKGFRVFGVDPSEKAIKEANHPDIRQGSAVDCNMQEMDVIIMGYCLCLCDPGALPAIVANVDRQLKTGGFLIIEDRIADPRVLRVEAISIDGWDEFSIHNFCFPLLWLSFPQYEGISEVVYEGAYQEAITVLRKRNPLA